MGRPAQRTREASLEIASAPPRLAPAPDTGTPYVGAQPTTAAAHDASGVDERRLARDFPNLGVRVSPELFERVRRFCEYSGMPKATLTARALDKFLADQGF